MLIAPNPSQHTSTTLNRLNLSQQTYLEPNRILIEGGLTVSAHTQKLLLCLLFLQFHNDWASVTTFIADVLLRKQPNVKAARKPQLWTGTSWTKLGSWLTMPQTSNYFTQVLNYAQLTLAPINRMPVLLCDLYVFFRIAHLEEIVMYLVSMVALQQYLTVLGCSSAGASRLHFLG